MKAAWVPFVIALLMSVLACNFGEIVGNGTPTPLPTETQPPITPSGTELAVQLAGEYFCSGHEAETLAAAAFLTLTVDGQVIDVPPPGIGGERATGSWRYQAETHQVLFEGNLDYGEADYSPGSGRLVVRLDESVERVHAEEGVMICELR